MVPDDLSAGSLEERKKVPGHMIRDRGIPVHLPPFEEIPIDVLLETEGKAPLSARRRRRLSLEVI